METLSGVGYRFHSVKVNVISTCVRYVSKTMPCWPVGDPMCVVMIAKLEVQVRVTGIQSQGNPSTRNAVYWYL